MARIFAYIVHKSGVVDDSALNLQLPRARLIPRFTDGHSHRFGRRPRRRVQVSRRVLSGDLENRQPALAYPNAELVRKALVKVLPSDSIVLVAHDHFGIDLAPGLSIKLNAAFVSDVVDISGVEAADLRQFARNSADR
jgi:electron transfer flavoprotein alpha subunit